jgi:hypothetical protein
VAFVALYDRTQTLKVYFLTLDLIQMYCAWDNFSHDLLWQYVVQEDLDSDESSTFKRVSRASSVCVCVCVCVLCILHVRVYVIVL